ncbi:uncharacterized protein LOC116922918 [Daphnia magna]|uniref:Uncharacterized protein n=1 Tax=Daphnia magna TaxID=35525 RepID=A0A0P4ZQ54_9CRUS|nr:uncharacterized protein LOC116922918 [Daphnia magna]KZS17092.1 Uncharacterized protein APZ42_017057 [Daphnia magna]
MADHCPYLSKQASLNSEKTHAGTANKSVAEERLVQLLEGQTVPVEMGNLPTVPPPWYNPVKFQRGQEFARRHFAGISLAHFVSLITMLTSPQILKPLIFTQKSETVLKSFKRYIGTVVHVTAWYFGDVWQKDHPARRSIQMVRSMHDHASNQMNQPDRRRQVDNTAMADCGKPFDDPPMLASLQKDAEKLAGCPYVGLRRQPANNDQEEPYVYFNQFDMADSQFAFVGVLVLFPHKFGATYASDDDLSGFIHFWRCIGYLLGIEDRFNFCDGDNLDLTRDLCRHYLDKMIKPAFKDASAEFEHMARAVAKGATLYYPGVSFESLFAYYANVVGLPAANFIHHMSYSQWFYYLYLRLVFSVLCWIPGVIRVFSGMTQFSIGLVVARSSTAGWWPKSWKPPQVGGLDVFWTLKPKAEGLKNSQTNRALNGA